jgi:2'-5' RNA ligase
LTQRRPESNRARLFFALWPERSVQAALGSLAVEAQAQCGGRAMVQDNIHLTLFFVGAFERAHIGTLERAAASVEGAPFALVIDRLGYWRHNRIVWAGVQECPPALARLASTLSAALAQIGLRAEDRPYVPHVTLVRNAERKPLRTQLAPCTWDVKDFVLVESVPVANGVRYQPLAAWTLAA